MVNNSSSSSTTTGIANNSNELVISSDLNTTWVDVTEYPVFISVTDETQAQPESEAVTETFMFVEDQEVEEDSGENEGNPDSVTSSPVVVVRSTTPMASPKSTPEQEEVLRELKKLWDISEGMSDSGNDALKNSLSSIVHLAYARVYIEPDETLQKLKYLLKQLQARILMGANLNGEKDDDGHSNVKSFSRSTERAPTMTSTKTAMSEASQAVSVTTTTSGPNDSTTKFSSHEKKLREKRSFYEGYDDNDEVDAIFFANVNSEENSVLPEKKNHYQHINVVTALPELLQSHKPAVGPSSSVIIVNSTKIDVVLPGAAIVGTGLRNESKISSNPLDRTLLQMGSMSPMSTTPSTLVQKVVHINDRKKPKPSFYLSPERIQELKNRVTFSSSSTTTTSTRKPIKISSSLSPFNIGIEDELENEVNLLQQHQQVDNYDIHISSTTESVGPLSTSPSPTNYFYKKPTLSGVSTISVSSSTFPPSPSTTELPYTAEDIALALFQLLRPEAYFEDESEGEETVTTLPPYPTPSNILYQVGSLSQVLNFTIKADNASMPTASPSPQKLPVINSKINSTTKVPLTSTMAPAKLNTTLSLLKLKEKYAKINATLLVPAPPAFLDLINSKNSSTSSGEPSTSTERQTQRPSNDIYDYTDVLDQTPAAADPSIASTIVQGTQDGVYQMVNSISRLSVGAKMVLLFSVSISILSIGFGVFALGPPLTGVGVLGIVIPIGLLLLFETTSSSGKRKLTARQREQLFIRKLQSEEFSKVLDMIFEAVRKYSNG